MANERGGVPLSPVGRGSSFVADERAESPLWLLTAQSIT